MGGDDEIALCERLLAPCASLARTAAPSTTVDGNCNGTTPAPVPSFTTGSLAMVENHHHHHHPHHYCRCPRRHLCHMRHFPPVTVGEVCGLELPTFILRGVFGVFQAHGGVSVRLDVLS